MFILLFTEIVSSCLSLRDKYGHKEYSGVFPYVIGEDKFPNLLLESNANLDRILVVMEPPDYDHATFDELVINEIREISGDGRLKIIDQTVRDSLKSMSLVDADRPLSEFPVAFAVGSCLCYMLTYKSWQMNTAPACNLEDNDLGSEAMNMD